MATNVQIDTLLLSEYRRYGRQMILPEIGKNGQNSLKSARVLIIGVGGLGCPALAYLAGAGVGTIGILDGDQLDLSNCHRQILHFPRHQGMSKVKSAAAYVGELNEHVKLVQIPEAITTENAIHHVQQFDIILDCTDNQATRYLISDACVLLKKPLVSGSALKTDGQLAIYNYRNGPCYRCLFPKPTPPENVLTCGEAGVLGPVVGIIGVLQALETIKLIVAHENDEYQPILTLFSAFGTPQWRSIKLRSKKKTCIICGDSPEITLDSFQDGNLDYELFCGTKSNTTLPSGSRISVKELQDIRESDPYAVIPDVRDKTQYGICSLSGTKNVQMEDISSIELEGRAPIYVVCRFGNDSQVAVMELKKRFPDRKVVDVQGGMNGWSKAVDPLFPIY